MKNTTRLAISGAILLTVGCQPKPSTDEVRDALSADLKARMVECTDCTWEKVIDQDMKVRDIACMDDRDQPIHCHLETDGYKPERTARMSYDNDTGAYTFVIQPVGDERMDCVNLAPDYDDDHVIRGTCIINDGHERPKVHYFKAVVQPRYGAPTKPEVEFYFRHRQIGLGGEPVHNGEGHAHPDD